MIQKRRGVLLVEFLVGLTLLLISAGAVTMNADIWEHTAKNEAEKISAYLSSSMLKADKTKNHFQIQLSEEKIVVDWYPYTYPAIDKNKDDVLESKYGCKYSWNAPNDKLYYSYVTNKFSQGATITVEGKGDPYYVVIATIGSRIRVSDTHP